MRARPLALLAAISVASLGLVAPAAAQAATMLKPDGPALVHIEGGTAYTKKLSKHEYRVVAPGGASITWMGDVKGRTRTGTFTPQGLMAGWKALGHADGKRAITTLSWTAAGSATPSFATVALGKPRMNAKGQLTFLANPLRATLPATMDRFSINITWSKLAKKATRGYPTTFPAFGVDSKTTPTVTAQVVLQGAANASVTFTGINSTPPVQCWMYGINLNVQSQQNLLKIPGTTCGNGHIDNKLPTTYINYSQVYWGLAGLTYDGSVTVQLGFTPAGDNAFSWIRTIAQFDDEGNNTLPAITAS